jgi:tetratricopeptide (TPR) repeat protein
MIQFRTNIIRYSLSFSFCLLLLSASAQDPNTLFSQGNKYYQDTDFEKAIKTYDLVLKSGYESAALYYNIGNSNFKLNQISAAILNYEKAKKIDPTNKDVLYNLKLANTRVVDKIESIPEFFFVTWYRNIVQQYSSNFWAYCFSGLFLLSIVSFLAYFFINNRGRKKVLFAIFGLLLIISMVTFFIANSKYSMENIRKEAIIFAENSYIKSAPSSSSQDMFILHEGTKVKIIEEVDGWNEIVLADGKRGWIEKKELQEI